METEESQVFSVCITELFALFKGSLGVVISSGEQEKSGSIYTLVKN